MKSTNIKDLLQDYKDAFQIENRLMDRKIKQTTKERRTSRTFPFLERDEQFCRKLRHQKLNHGENLRKLLSNLKTRSFSRGYVPRFRTIQKKH